MLASLQRNLDAGEAGDAARTYWLPDLGGAEITLEIEVPAGTDPALVQLAIPRLTPMFVQADALALLARSAMPLPARSTSVARTPTTTRASRWPA